MLWLVFALCIVVMLVNSRRPFRITPAAIQLADALGLGLFVASGVQASLASGMPMAVSVIMGIITGVFGGVMRDIACGEMPTAFLTIVRMPCVRWLAAGCMRFWRFTARLPLG